MVGRREDRSSSSTLTTCSYWLLLVVVIHTVSVASKLSGHYYDNGRDQTTIVTTLDLHEKEVMQEEILHLLGLNTRPHRSQRRVLDSNENHAVPTFMKDIYTSLLNEAGDEGEIKNLTFQNLNSLQQSSFNLEDKDLQAINESDVIMSFVNYGHQEEFETTRRFWFDVSEVPLGDAILSTELRIFKQAREGVDEEYKVSVYQLVEGSTGEEELLDFVTVTLNQEGWIILDVTAAMVFWQAFPKHNLGLMLKTTKAGADVAPHDLGMIGVRQSHSPHESFMVAFIKNEKEGGVTLNSRTKRTARKKKKGRKSQSSRREKKYSYLESDFGYENAYSDFYGGRNRRRGCQKRTLYVSFRDLGWQDWIIAPDGYAAFYCHGECSFPLNTHMNATNHAIVQTLVHLMTPYQVPKPCCAPTKLSGISVLYFDESSNVILKKYRNMVVKSCGCH